MLGKQHLLFPSVLHEISLPSFKEVEKDLINFVYQERKQDPKGQICSNRGGWQSSAKYMNGENILKETIIKYLSEYFTVDQSNPLVEGINVDLTSIWININNKNNYNSLHTHPGHDLAGVLWIKVPKMSGNIVFNSPNEYTDYNQMMCYNNKLKEEWKMFSSYSYQSVAGKMFLFPASLYHMVETNQTKHDRISSSFNIHLRYN